MMGFLIFDFGFSIFSRSRSARCTQQWATGRRQSPDGRQQPPVGRQRAAINNQKSTIKNQKWLLLLLLATALPRLAIAADSITVIQDNAPVMSGRTILTRLARGTKLPVKRTQGSWYGVNVQVDGKRTFGWVHRKYVVPTKQAASVETQAQQAFEKLKAEADKLAAQGKYQEAIDLVDSFPERYWHTAAQNKVRELGLALEKRASGDPKFLEAEAEAEFHKCKSAAETLVKQGKLAEAVQALTAFPGKYAQTRWGKELLEYRIELEGRRRAPLAPIEKEVWQLVRDGKFGPALAKVDEAIAGGTSKDHPQIKATRAYIELHKKAAAKGDAISPDPRITDPYTANAQYNAARSQLVRMLVPPHVKHINVKRGKQILRMPVPTVQQQAAMGKKLVGVFTWSPRIHLAAARACARATQFDDALKLYRKARQLDLDRSVVSLDATLELARVLTHTKRPDLAATALNASLRRMPDDALAQRALGDAYLAAGHKAKAIAAWNKALKINPDQPDLAGRLRKAKGQPPKPSPTDPLELPALFNQVAPSCVVVSARQSSGSGFAISADGLIATNLHVIAPGGIAVRVKREGKFVVIPFVEVVLIAPVHDIAILKVNARRSRFRPLPLGSAKSLQTGQAVVVVGNPGMGGRILDYTITRGIVSNLDRELAKGVHFVQTDAAINPGNSGGPMFDLHGHVVGMVTRKAKVMENAGFSLHIDHVRDVLPACFPQAP